MSMMPTIYVIQGRRDDAKAVCASLAGNWIITSRSAPYELMELNDVERLYPLKLVDDPTADELQMIQDNIHEALKVVGDDDQ